MARARKYKRLEKNIVSRIMHSAGAFFKKIAAGFVCLFKFFDEKLTIMIVPHSQGKVINLQTNVFALLFGLVVVVGVAGSFVS